MTKIITPTGRALFPALNPGFPDTTYEPVYQVLLCGTPEHFGDFIKQIQALHEKAIKSEQDALDKAGKNKKVKVHNLPIVEDIKDKDGNLTGEIALKCKLKFEKKFRDGKVVEQTLQLYDSKGKPYNGSEEIGNGSKLKIGVYPRAWNSPALGVGITLEIGAVFIIDLISKSGRANSAEEWGFEEEEGFTAIPEPVSKASSETQEEDSEVNFNF